MKSTICFLAIALGSGCDSLPVENSAGLSRTQVQVIGNYEALDQYAQKHFANDDDLNFTAFMGRYEPGDGWGEYLSHAPFARYSDPRRVALLGELKTRFVSKGYDRILLIEILSEHKRDTWFCLMGTDRCLDVIKLMYVESQPRLMEYPCERFSEAQQRRFQDLAMAAANYAKSAPPYEMAKAGHVPSHLFSGKGWGSAEPFSFGVYGMPVDQRSVSFYEKHLDDPRAAREKEFFIRTRPLAEIVRAGFDDFEIK